MRVAVGVILDERGAVLVARRHDHLHQGGLLEFPGGKLQPGEAAREALERELAEELGIRVEQAAPLLEIEHSYPDKRVRLEVWVVTAFAGTPRGLQGQPLAWLPVPALEPARFPAANAPIIEALRAGRVLTGP